jgi:TolA-binding protein
MKSMPNLFFVSLFCLSLFSCVTTRDQMNAEKGIGVGGDVEVGKPSGVQSEDITPHKASTSELPEPEVVQKNTPTLAPSNGPSTGAQAAAPVATQGSAVAIPQPNVADYTPDELRSEVARLSGKVEEVEHDKKLTEQQYTDQKKKDEDRIAELEKKLKELQPEAQALPEGKSPFEAGKDAALGGKCDDAITFLSQALTKVETGKEAEEATYLRGECYFKKSQFNKAIVDFSHFPEKFQKSSYHPKALLRIAESFEAMGRKDDAKAFYSDLVDKFSKTAEGKLAKKRLKAKK